MNIPDEYKTGNPGMDAKIEKTLAKGMQGRYLRFPNGSTIQIEEPKKSKYSNTKTDIAGITFHSKKEAKRYEELKLLEKAHKISFLTLQPVFELYAGIKYIADFKYLDNERPDEKWIVEDVKGMKTDVYKIKKKLFLDKYTLFIFREI